MLAASSARALAIGSWAGNFKDEADDAEEDDERDAARVGGAESTL